MKVRTRRERITEPLRRLGFSARTANVLAQVGVRGVDDLTAPDLVARMTAVPRCPKAAIDELRWLRSHLAKRYRRSAETSATSEAAGRR